MTAMDDLEYRKLVYEQLSSLTIAASALSRAITSIHLGNKDEVIPAIQEALSELSDAFERLDQLSSNLE